MPMASEVVWGSTVSNIEIKATFKYARSIPDSAKLVYTLDLYNLSFKLKMQIWGQFSTKMNLSIRCWHKFDFRGSTWRNCVSTFWPLFIKILAWTSIKAIYKKMFLITCL